MAPDPIAFGRAVGASTARFVYRIGQEWGASGRASICQGWAHEMRDYAISLTIGFGVGVVYGLCRFRSPAPPLIALVGLLGMLLGEQAIAHLRSRGGGAAVAKIEPPASGPSAREP